LDTYYSNSSKLDGLRVRAEHWRHRDFFPAFTAFFAACVHAALETNGSPDSDWKEDDAFNASLDEAIVAGAIYAALATRMLRRL
jgi:hypothetical protein